MKKLVILLLIFSAFLGCKSRNGTPRTPKLEVPMALNVNLRNNATINFVNTNYYRLQLLNDLEQFQSVNFVLVEKDENPEVVLDINVNNFTLWPRDERVSRRRVSRNIVVGTDQAGKPVYQTVTASVDLVQVQRRSNANFQTSLSIKGEPGLKFSRTFVPSFNYVNTYVDNIQGDPRALDASIGLSRGPGFEPTEEEFLLLLSRREMVRRLSNELRKYYDQKTKAAENN